MKTGDEEWRGLCLSVTIGLFDFMVWTPHI